MQKIAEAALKVLEAYRESFSTKQYQPENNDGDPLMDVFGITPELKRENRQYWGRELGMCWQRLAVSICSSCCSDYSPAQKVGGDEPGDFFLGKDAIDTKYRIGSGDSGTLKKFKAYGKEFVRNGYRPVLLIVRRDNLPAALTACKAGQWTILEGTAAFDYLKERSGFDVQEWLNELKEGKKFFVQRNVK